VLFNEPKLLKYVYRTRVRGGCEGFSALQRAEIAEIEVQQRRCSRSATFQCSSTSRNC